MLGTLSYKGVNAHDQLSKRTERRLYRRRSSGFANGRIRMNRPYYVHEREYKPAKADTIGKPLLRFAVSCWDTLHAFAHNRPADAVVCVLAPDQQKAQDSVRELRGPFEAFETRVATKHDEEHGLTLNDFRNKFNTR